MLCASPETTISVFDSRFRFSHNYGMAIVTHDDIREALTEALKARRFTNKSIATMLGVADTRITEIRHGRRRIQPNEMHILAEFLGLGDVEDDEAYENNVILVPVIGIASAGAWREAIEMPSFNIPRLKVKGENQAFAVEICGDSMDRVIQPGNWAIIDPDQRDLFSGRVYLISNGDGDAMIKRYRESPARFEPDSHNPEHQPIMYGEHVIKVIGRVVAFTGDKGLK